MERLLKYAPDIDKATIFKIQNVADYFYNHPREHWDMAEFCLAPPFDYMATKYAIPNHVYSDEKGHTYPENAGYDILSVLRSVENFNIGHADFYRGENSRPVRVPGTRWCIEARLWMLDKNTLIANSGWDYCLDDRGYIVKHKGDYAFWAGSSRTIGDSFVFLPTSHLHVSGLALSFLNCRNVFMGDAYPEKRKKKATKRQPRQREWEAKYHTIKIGPVGSGSSGSAPKHTGIRMSVHIVPGMFREYGPEYVHKFGPRAGQPKGKLFGRYSGRFWVPSHMRGSGSVGAVKKEYEVEIKKDE